MSIQLLNGDCLELMKDISANSIDCFICDLPYGCLTQGYARKNHNEEIKRKVATLTKSRCAWDIQIDLVEFWKQVERLMKNDHTPIIMFCNTKFGYDLIKSKEDWFRYDLVWEKTIAVGFLSANKQPLRAHENIYIFAKKGAFYVRKDIEGDFKQASGGRTNSKVYNGIFDHNTENEGKRCLRSVIKQSLNRQKDQHPTQKPIQLYKILIERYCPEGGTLLDPTAGSCNSCFAGYELNRHCIGIEKDKGFYEKAVKKMESL